jgi:hypothetical protein
MIRIIVVTAVTKNANIKVEVTHAKQRQLHKQNRANDVEEEPHLMVAIVVLILSASAITVPPLGPSSSLSPRLRNEGVTKKE